MNFSLPNAFCLGALMVLTLTVACGGSQVRECHEPFSSPPGDLGETPPESAHAPGDTPNGCDDDSPDGAE